MKRARRMEEVVEDQKEEEGRSHADASMYGVGACVGGCVSGWEGECVHV